MRWDTRIIFLFLFLLAMLKCQSGKSQTLQIVIQFADIFSNQGQYYSSRMYLIERKRETRSLPVSLNLWPMQIKRIDATCKTFIQCVWTIPVDFDEVRHRKQTTGNYFALYHKKIMHARFRPAATLETLIGCVFVLFFVLPPAGASSEYPGACWECKHRLM